VKTRFFSKVIKFKQVLEFKKVILLCYGWQNTITLQQKVLKVEIWAIPKALIGVFENCVVTTCVMNQS
jgi:hypothetical protein